MSSVDHRIARVLSLAVLMSLVGCSEVIDVPDDPRLVTKGPWWCLDRPSEPIAPQGDTAVVRIQACNFVSTNCSEPATGITAKLCDKKDVTCSNPIQPRITDVDGALVFDVLTGGVLGVGFDGYLQITPPYELCTNQAVFGDAVDVLCGFVPGCDKSAPDQRCLFPVYAPSFLFFNPAIKSDVTTPLPLPLVPTAAVLSLIQASGAQMDPTAGMIFINAVDCNGNPASGVSFQTDKHQDRVTVLYVENGVVSNTVTETGVSGLGGFINVPSGFVGVEGLIAGDDGTRRPMGKFGVQVTTFNMSYSTLVPPP